MKEFKVPLQIFGPQALCQWLFHEWDSLESASKKALGLLHTQLAKLGGVINGGQLAQLSTALEYERALTALADEDFRRFIEWALDSGPWPEGWSRPKIPLGLDDLDVEHQELRQLLILTFARERIWPRQGFRSLLQEAVDAAGRARNALGFAAPNIFSLKRYEAIRHVHDGLDRALLWAEQFLDLLLEFLALLVSHLGWASSEEVAKWIAAVGLKGKRPEQWSRKQYILGVEIGTKFWEDLEAGIFRVAPNRWEFLWENVCRLIKLVKYEKYEDEKQWRWYPSGDLAIILDRLREYRNFVRHSIFTLQESQGIPEAYIDVASKVCEDLQKLWRMVNEDTVIPQTAKILRYSIDCYGGIEFTLGLETQRIVIARYIHEMDSNILAKGAKDSPALAQVEYEFFLFPSPKPEEHMLISPLLLRRTYTFRELGEVGIREEVLAIMKAIEERVKATPIEEKVEEV